jgi:hypothetical protein
VDDLPTLIGNLRKYKTFIAGFPLEQQASRIEHLFARSLSLALRLPFYTLDNDDSNVKHRVVWNGSKTNWTRGEGTPDGIVYAHEYCILLEATLKTGTKQWTQEVSRSLQHYEDFAQQTGLRSQDCYLLMLVTELNSHTYTMVKQKVKERCCYVLLPVANLVSVLETCALAFTIRHADLRLLFGKIMDSCERSVAVADFLTKSAEEVGQWRVDRLENEQSLFVSAKSYRVLKHMGRHAGVSEIYGQLYSDSSVAQYFEALGRTLTYNDIVDSLERESLAYKAENIPSGEAIYFPVPFLDIKDRVKTFIREMENAGASL